MEKLRSDRSRSIRHSHNQHHLDRLLPRENLETMNIEALVTFEFGLFPFGSHRKCLVVDVSYVEGPYSTVYT